MMTVNTNLENAYAECERIARGHYENFPVGSLLIPKALRPHFFALYAFMRTADDFADLRGRNAYEKQSELAQWRENLAENRCYFPIEDLTRFGIGRPDAISHSKNAGSFVAFECERIQLLLDRGKALPNFLHGRLRYEIRAVLAGAEMMMTKIRTSGSAIFHERPALTSNEQKMLILKALF